MDPGLSESWEPSIPKSHRITLLQNTRGGGCRLLGAAGFAVSASLLQPPPPTGETIGGKARLDPRRAPSGPIARQTRIHARRCLCPRRSFGQTPSQQRPRPRQNPPTTPSPPRPWPPRLPRLRLLSPIVSNAARFWLAPHC